jgi:hypothetical protein
MESLVVAFQAFWRLVAWAKNERHARFQSSDPHPETVRQRVKAFFSEISIPFVHAWYSTRRALWTLRYTIRTFIEWFKDPIQLSKQTRERAEELAENARRETCPDCECRMCCRLRTQGAGDDEKFEKPKQGSSVGEKLVGGIERLYTVKRASRMEDGEMESGPEHGLSLVTTISRPIPGGGRDPTSLAQPRRNPEPSARVSISRRPLPPGSEPTEEGESEALLLGHDSSEPAPRGGSSASELVEEYRI